MTVDHISPEELNWLLEEEASFFLLDVRDEEVFQKWHIEGKNIATLNAPFGDFVKKGAKIELKDSASDTLLNKLPKDKKIVVVCARGNSSALTARLLKREGFSAFSLEGGMQKWGLFFDWKKIVETPDFSIFQLIRPSKGCLSYAVISEGEAIIIDPFRILLPYTNFLKNGGFNLRFVLDTHAHADHISGGYALSKEYKVPYYLHPYDGIHPMDVMPAVIEYEPSWKNTNYQLGKINLKTLHIPGHTLGNQAFLLEGKYLFTGDSIFIHSVARPDLGGKGEQWTELHYHSLRKLLELPDETVVLPAHFSSLYEADSKGSYQRTLGELKETNTGLIEAQKSLKEFSSYILENLPNFPEQYIEIKRVNLGLLQPDEAKASELELGKNVCAIS